MRTTWREMPRGSGTTYWSVHSSSGRCQGRVTSAGLGWVATMRRGMGHSLAATRSGGLEEDRAGAAWGDLVVGVVQTAGAQAETAAPDAAVELVAQPLEPLDLLVDARSPAPREPRPVGLRGRAPFGERGQRLLDLVEGEPDTLRRADERDPAEHRLAVPPLVAGGALGADQPPRLVVAQSRRGNA